MLIYLDCCCFGRLFDDQRQERIRLEAEAVTSILSRVEAGEFRLLGSDVLIAEFVKDPNELRRETGFALDRLAEYVVPADEHLRSLIRELSPVGLRLMDTAHLASAILGNAEIFLTVDDQLLRKAGHRSIVNRVQVMSPVTWLLEQE